VGTITATSSNHNATIGNITAGADTAAADGNVDAIKASGFLVATVGTVDADSVGSIIVESTDTTTGGAASVGNIDDGSGNGAGSSKAVVGNVDVSSKKSSGATGTIDAAQLGNVTITGATTAATGVITVANTAGDSTVGNITISAGTGTATLGDLDVEKVGTISVKSTTGAIVHNAVTVDDATGLTLNMTATGSTIQAGAADDKILNTKGDMSVTVKATGFGTTEEAEFEAGTASATDIDMSIDLSGVSGNVGTTVAGEEVVVNNLAQDSASSTVIKGGQAENYIVFDGHAGTKATGGTVTYYGQNDVDEFTLGANAYASSTVYAEGGADIISVGKGQDTIVLTEATSAADIVVVADDGYSSYGTVGGTFSGFDVITGFATTVDHIDHNDASFAGAALTFVVANTLGAGDLAAANYKDVTSVLAFLNDGTVEDALAADTADYAANEDILVGVTLGNGYTAVYEIYDATAATLVAGDVALIAYVDATMVVGDFM
jgi:hypothetical protein